MQQLLSLNGQSELFTQLADEVSLSSRSVSSGKKTGKDGATEFSQALLDGLDALQKNLSANKSDAKIEQAQPSMKRIAFDDEVVGEPVESPLLEMLEEMRALLQPGKSEFDGGTTGSIDKATDVDTSAAADKAIANLSEILNQLGNGLLSADQRQQLAEEIHHGLSETELDVLSMLDAEALKAADDKKQLPDAESDLLQKLQSVSELAELALQQNMRPRDNGETLDRESRQWLDEQLTKLTQRTEPAKTADRSSQVELQNTNQPSNGNILQWLQQQVSEASELNTKQKQQLQQWLDGASNKLSGIPQTGLALANDQNSQINEPMTRVIDELRKLLSETSNKSDQIAPRLSGPVTANERSINTDSVPNDGLRHEFGKHELNKQEPNRQENNRQAPVKTSVSQSDTAFSETKMSAANADSRQQLKPGSDIDASAEPGGRIKTADGQQQTISAAQLLDKAVQTNAPNTTGEQAANRIESANSFSENLINQQVTQVSTQSGNIKASELSSTLQSTMQAIQKPLDPQQSEASQKLQERINIMMSKNIQRADIRLDPPDLGHMNVRINMNAEQASVQFQVQSTQARDVVEQALPRLREMLEQQGVALADTDVQHQQQQRMGGDSEQQGRGGESATASAEQISEHEILLNEGRPLAAGAVDFYV